MHAYIFTNSLGMSRLPCFGFRSIQTHMYNKGLKKKPKYFPQYTFDIGTAFLFQ